jgi:hypothetical protein
MKKIIKISVLAFVFGFMGVTTLFAASPAPIDLGTAGNYVILAKTGVSTTGATSVTGDVGISPAEATYITGFGLILPTSGAYSTSSLITGKVYAPSYATPTPTSVSTAVSDMQTAYTDGAGRAAGVTELGAGNIGGLTLVPGVYKWGTGVTIPTDLTLSGSANDVWIFQIAQNLDISSAKKIILSGGAKANNIFWVVAGQTTIGTGAEFNGNILDQTAIVLNTGATLNGRALAQTAVTLDASDVTIPSGSSSNSDSNNDSNSNDDSNSDTNDDSNTNSNSNSNTNEENENTTSTIEQGCSNGNIFNISTGKKCINNSEISQGCSNGNIFNTATGAQCINNSNDVISKHDFGDKTLKLWDRGEYVKELQKFLNAELNHGLILDGILGDKTTAEIKIWQKANGLEEDGFVGAKTKIKMNL